MGVLRGVGLRFQEAMAGWIVPGDASPQAGGERGGKQGARARFDVTIVIDDLERFLHDPRHAARLTGTVEIAALGGPAVVREGVFRLLQPDPATDRREIRCEFPFAGADGQVYRLVGRKEVQDDLHALDVVDDMTRLFTTIYRGEAPEAPIYGAGQLFFPCGICRRCSRA